MSFNANIMTDIYGNFTVQMKGGLDYENSIPLRDELELLARKGSTNITLDMMKVDFVGSSGIGTFVETIRSINNKYKNKIRLMNVSPEFVKVFKIYTKNDEELLIEDFDFDNDETFSMGGFAGRKRTFEN